MVWKKAACSLLAASLALAGMTGCSKEEESVKVPEPKITQAFPALSAAQIKKVFREVGQTVDKADADLNADELGKRVVDPALSVRKAQYDLAQKKTKDEDNAEEKKEKAKQDVIPMTFDGGTVTLTASKEWPRYVVHIGAKDADSPTFVQILKQDDARSQFKLWHWVRMFPEQSVPETAVSQKGTPLVEPDSSKVKTPPVEALKAYTDNVFDEKKLTEAGFSQDVLAEVLRKENKAYKDVLDNKYDFSHTVKPEGDPVAIRLENGGALVFGQLVEDYNLKRTNEDARLKMPGDIGVLLGNEGKADKGFKATYKMLVLMTIPPEGESSDMKIIGAERVLTHAEALS